MNDQIAQHIRENRLRHTRDAITQQLVAAGQDPALVAAAWAVVEAEPATRIEDYIRDNRGRYTREAITDQLAVAGHDRDAIEAGWAVVNAQAGQGTGGFIKGYTAAIVLLGGLGFALFLFLAQSLSYPYGLGSDDVPVVIVGLLVYAALGFGLFKLVSVFVQGSTPGTGAAVAAGCLVPLAVIGICMASSLPASVLQ
jgi:hypothetical protein